MSTSPTHPPPPAPPPPSDGDDDVTIERGFVASLAASGRVMPVTGAGVTGPVPGTPVNPALTTLRIEQAPESSEPQRPYLLVIAGPRLGEMVLVDGQIVIGRDPAAGLPILDESVSRRHARITIEGREARLVDLASTNGTWVNGRRVSSQTLASGDRFRVGQTTVIKFAWQDAIEEQYQRQLLDTALRDALTPTFNARYFGDRLDADFRENSILGGICHGQERHQADSNDPDNSLRRPQRRTEIRSHRSGNLHHRLSLVCEHGQTICRTEKYSCLLMRRQ